MKLKPCPFCGSAAKSEEFSPEEWGIESKNFKCARVVCTDSKCSARVNDISFKPIEVGLKIVTDKWNKRSKSKQTIK